MVRTNDPEPVWDKPNDVPEKWIETVDDNVYIGKSFLRDRGPMEARELTRSRIAARHAGQGNLPPCI